MDTKARSPGSEPNASASPKHTESSRAHSGATP
jgi:hypothetical protein